MKSDTLKSAKDNVYMASYFLFAHTFSSCDTTSAFFSKSKKKLFSILQKEKDLRDRILIFFKSLEVFIIHYSEEMFDLSDITVKSVLIYCLNTLRSYEDCFIQLVF